MSITSTNETSPDDSGDDSHLSSAMITSQHTSPGAMLNSLSPQNGIDSNIATHNGWHGQPTPSQIHMRNQMMAAMSMPQQMPSFPQQPFNGNIELKILPTPLKSRVETQIRIHLALNALPPGVMKLHLPPHTISKPKLLSRPPPTKSSDMLELHVSLVCTSAIRKKDLREAALRRATQTPQGYLPDRDDEKNNPRNGGDVRICDGCITRERKRAGRKKTKKPDEEKLWGLDEARRVIVFNSPEIQTWKPIGNEFDAAALPPGVTPASFHVSAPMRIACYCRHHGEKTGFNVIFTIKDWQDRVIAQAMSEPIMITDDHKTQPGSTQSVPTASAAPSPPSQGGLESSMGNAPLSQNGIPVMSDFGAFSTSADMNMAMDHNGQHTFPSPGFAGNTQNNIPYQQRSTRSLSRSASPSPGGPMAKKRKSSSSRIPHELAMTRLETMPPNNAQMPSAQPSAATSPFSAATAFSPPDSMFTQTTQTRTFGTDHTTPTANDQGFFGNHRSQSFDNLAMAQLYSAPVSHQGSRAASPTGRRTNFNNNLTQQQLAQALANSLYSIPMDANQGHEIPVIHKIIPNEGPKMGGIEVTVLGGSFFQGLEVWFGDRKATTTTFWGDTSLVCLLPPSPVAGAVPVSFQRQGATTPGGFGMGNYPMFKYVDDSEEKLMRGRLISFGKQDVR